ncbi:MAG: translation elongation factor Ts, partial [Alphaproteobacteria bacterium]|nr:translation elongation factor Ts [Alphaproteobacteria bacterium]
VEVNSETDFVARNEAFQDFVKKTTAVALETGEDLEAVKAADLDGKSVADTLTDLIAKIGENMTLRRVEKLSVSDGIIGAYVHNAVADGLGKIGVLVALESTGDKEKLEALGKQIAMHIAAAFPKFLDRESVDTTEMERERAVLKEQAVAEGKPADIAEKMVEGRMRKYFEEVCLLEQTFVIDNETKIADLVKNAASDVGADVTLKAYARVQLGEGIEKEEEDFAAEVAKTAANG